MQCAGPEGAGDRPVVVFVHGLNSSRAMFLVGMHFLRARAKHLGPMVCLRYRTRPEDGMHETANVVRDKVMEECRQHAATRVVLIGHSA
eukprot:CAMPEP_0172025176 /NCGR_PEP_ID=MMETSP1041-20130122/15750_1 /TAXON_ID=464988 /ORGANISM="Hemiselmis andersenii, Strain CCMP439" /LENGTH=88 /DNA_ID=CAMNT_0012680839 /DNA_START=34 /DNA_END=297 /DNA_ORIENTATION=-